MANTPSKNSIHKSNTSKIDKTQKTSETAFLQKIIWLEWLIYSAIIGFVFFYFYNQCFDNKIYLGGDNAEYYILGKSLSMNNGYSYIANINAPAHNHFPPGYPFILSLLMRIGAESQSTLTYFNGLFLFFSILLSLWLLKTFSGSLKFGFSIAILLCLHYHLLHFATILMSEISFLFSSTVCLFFFLNIKPPRLFWKNPNFYAFVTFLIISIYIRTAGVAMLLTFLTYLSVKKQWKTALATCILVVIAFVPWQIRSSNLGGNAYMRQLVMVNPYHPEQGSMGTILPDSTSAIKESSAEHSSIPQTTFSIYKLYEDIKDRVFKNSKRYVSREIPAVCAPWIESDFTTSIQYDELYRGILICLIVVLGLFKVAHYRSLLIIYMIFSFGVLLLWPSVWAGPRFIFPLIPLILFFFLNGIKFILEWLLRSFRTKLPILQNAIIPYLFLALTIKYYSYTFFDAKLKQDAYRPCVQRLKIESKLPYSKNYKNYFELATWSKSNVPDTSVICVRKQGLFYCFSNRYVTGFQSTTNHLDLLRNLAANSVDYVVLDPLGFNDVSRYLYPAIQKYPQMFQVIKKIEKPDTYLLKFKPDAKILKTTQ